MIDIKADFGHLFLLIKKSSCNQRFDINAIYINTTQYYQC